MPGVSRPRPHPLPHWLLPFALSLKGAICVEPQPQSFHHPLPCYQCVSFLSPCSRLGDCSEQPKVAKKHPA